MMYYLNEDKTYRKCCVKEWGYQLEHINRKVCDDLIDNYHISTVWLGVDHSYSVGVPLLFETMVFNNPRGGNDIYMMRYTTYEQAVEGHKKAIEWVLNGCKEED